MSILKKLFGKKSGGCCTLNLDEEIEKARQENEKKEIKEAKKEEEIKPTSCCCKK